MLARGQRFGGRLEYWDSEEKRLRCQALKRKISLFLAEFGGKGDR
jgi:hypothetical protein